MKSFIAIAASLLIASPVLAQVKPCEELKGEIDAKIKNNGVPAFTTTIVDKDVAEDGKVVGTCDGGSKKTRRNVSPRRNLSPRRTKKPAVAGFFRTPNAGRPAGASRRPSYLILVSL